MDDTFAFSYAGHGFSKLDENFITSYDTQPTDPVATSMSLQGIYKQLRECPCRRVILLLDACESGILDVPARSIFSHLSPAELDDFFSKAEFCVCFASSETSQSSYSAAALKHGIWSYHVIEALKGNAPEALVNGRYLTAASLQDHLSRSVPTTIAKVLSIPVHQTPRLYGTHTNGTFLTADLQEVFDNRAALCVPGYQQVTRLTLTGDIEFRVRNLSGFTKYHTVPDEVNAHTLGFVAKISSAEIRDEIEEVHRLLRTKMGYSRRDLSSGTDVGTGSVITPDFDYGVTMTLDPADPSTAVLGRELSNIKKPSLIDSQEFGEVFAKRFSNLELALKQKITIDDWIDRIEALKSKGLLASVRIDYPCDSSRLEIRFSDNDQTMTLFANSCQISQRLVQPPARLFQMLVHFQQRLLAVPELRQLPF